MLHIGIKASIPSSPFSARQATSALGPRLGALLISRRIPA